MKEDTGMDIGNITKLHEVVQRSESFYPIKQQTSPLVFQQQEETFD